MFRRVRIFPLAELDLLRIAESIRIRVSLKSSKYWIKRLRAAITDLKDSAEQHPEAEETALVSRNVRMRIIGNRSHVYRILFTYTSDFVNVHRVRHAAQDSLTEDDI